MNKIVSDTFIFNRTGGCEVNPTRKNLEGGYGLIKSELDETLEAIERVDGKLDASHVTPAEQGEILAELADGAADIIVTAIGLLYRAGLSQSAVEDVLTVVGAANKAKFDSTEEEAQKSVEAYSDDPRYTNVHYVQEGRRYAIKGTVVTDRGSYTKILKSHLWQDPEAELLEIMRRHLEGDYYG